MRTPFLNRILSGVLAAAAVVSLLPLVSISTREVSKPEKPVQSPVISTPVKNLPWDYDTLHITMNDKDADALSLYPHEKVELKASGLAEEATYQWQVQHPTNDEVWVNILDGTKKTISVSQALVANVLREDGTAKLRCRAYTEDSAFLTKTFTVSLIRAAAMEPEILYAQQDVAPLADDPGVPEFVTVTIEYIKYDFLRDNQDKLVLVDGKPVYDDGKVAFTSYMATIRGGSELKTTVHFPTIVGYDAYWEDDATPSTQHVFNEDSITQNYTYRVSYRPALVNYTVRYFFQNIYDDLYVEDSTKKITSEGYTGATPPDSELNAQVNGYTALYYQPDAIAADGSTVFEVYYERNYYLMEFDCNGGYGSDTVYVRYGSHISVPNPTRPGYAFMGWDLVNTDQTPKPTLGDNVSEALPATMPPYNSAYKAIWDAVATSYTVVYWRENADNNEYSYWGSVPYGLGNNGQPDGSVISATYASGSDNVPTSVSNAIVDGNTVDEKIHFTYNDALTDKNILIEGDGSTVVNVYYDRKVYTLQFNVGNNDFNIPLGGHVHTDGNCMCDYTHVHGPDCESTLTCTIPAHTAHTAECVICKETEHTHGASCALCNQEGHIHTDACCGITPHIHGLACYSPNTGYAVADGNDRGYSGVISQIESPKSGYIYRYNYYNYNYYNYFYDENTKTWYYLGSNNQYRGLFSGTPASSDSGSYSVFAVTKAATCGETVHEHNGEDCDYSGCSLHVHTESCYKCGQIEHTHSAKCCTLTPHTHDLACYKPNTGYVAGISSNSDTTNNAIAAISDPKEGYLYRYNRNGTYYNFFYTSSGWYYLGTGNQYRGLLRDTTIANPSQGNYTVSTSPVSTQCGTVAHSHDDGNCSYCTNGHEHNDSCMDCGMAEHTHEDSCYKDILHSHVDDCYEWSCGNTTHVHTEACCTRPISYTEGTGSSKKYFIKAKYNQTIGDIWPTAANFPNIKFRAWDFANISADLVSKRVNMTHDLCYTGGVHTAVLETTTGNTQLHLHYMFESFDQTSGENGNDRKKLNGVYYDKSELYYQVVNEDSLSAKEIMGMSPGSTNIVGNIEFLYYKRNRATLQFHNVNTVVYTVSDLMYQFPLKDVKVNDAAAELYEPPYPSVYEPGAYEFKGWYTTPECFDNTEVDWDTLTMPDGKLTLYAKWTPIMRSVVFYSSYDDIQADKDDTSSKKYHFMKAENVPHGSTLGSTYLDIPEWPQDLDPALNGGAMADMYDFVGWFYMDENGKKRFAPDSMEVTRDLILFAEWQTSVDTTYEVQYVLAEDVTDKALPSGKDYLAGEPVGDTIFAHSTVGKTKTFDAKGGTSLYPDFRSHFFPEVNSHSILMEQNGDENKFTFRYRYDDIVYYKVRYVDYATRLEIGPKSKIVTSDNAIVTEKFYPIEGYLPQNYYITKALAYDGNATSPIDENVITFYYNRDTEHGLYSVEYYLENPDSTNSADPNNYYQYESIVGSDDIGRVFTADIRSYEGYTHVPGMNTVITFNTDGTVKNQTTGVQNGSGAPYGTIEFTGLTIKIYYKRNAYPYVIEYREYGSNDLLMTVESANAKFDTEKTHTAQSSFALDGLTYEYYIDDADVAERTKSMTIRVPVADDPSTAIDETYVNKLTFYYTKHEVLVHYIPVCQTPGATDYGGLSFYNELVSTVSAMNGSNAIPGEGFKFMGWYYDEDCTLKVPDAWVSDPDLTDSDTTKTKLVPKTLDTSKDEESYYALFVPITTDLTIRKQVSGVPDGMPNDDTFLFRIKGLGKHAYLEMTVAITVKDGAGAVTIRDIPLDSYTITELTGWSWEYDIVGAASQEITLAENAASNLVSFSNTYANPDWLGDECNKDNNFN